MAEPSTPGAARRQGLRRSRWIAAGSAVGVAVVLTGTIAVVNAAPSDDASSPVPVGVSDDGEHRNPPGYDDGFREYDEDDEFEEARPFTPQQQAPSQPQLPSRPQTRSGGS